MKRCARAAAQAAWLLTLAVVAMAIAPARAQDAPERATVLRVEIVGLAPADLPAAQARISTRRGELFDERSARADQKRLMASGQYEDAAVITSTTDEGIVVRFIMKKRLVVEDVEFEGNRHFSDKKLRGELAVSPGAALDRSTALAGVRSLEARYRKAGFYFVAVSFDEALLESQRRLVYAIIEGPRVSIEEVRYEFVDGDGDFAAVKLGTKVSTGDGVFGLFATRLNDDKLESDVESLRRFYREKGYLDAEVARRLDFSADRSEVEVVFVIDEGPRYRVSRVILNGNRLYADGELIGQLGLVRGDVHLQEQLDRDVKTLRDAYGRLGYVNANVQVHTVFVDPAETPPADLAEGDRAFVALVYDIREGARYRLGRIELRGNNVTKDRVVRRQLQMHPGSFFDTRALELSEQNLNRVGLFEKATITPFGGNAGTRDAMVSVDEGNTTNIGLSFGASSNGGILGGIRYRQSNFSWTRMPKSFSDAFLGSGFKGDGQTLELSLEPGSEIMRATVRWMEPKLRDGPFNLNLNSYVLTLNRDSYEERRIGSGASLGRSLGGLWYGELSSGLENYEIRDFEDDAPSEFLKEDGFTTLGSLGAALVRNGVDNQWLPSQGGKLTLSASQSMIDYSFFRTSAEYVHYFTPWIDTLDRKHILAVKGQASSIVGNVPHSRMLYGGGLTHVRGFRHRGISPRTADPITVMRYEDRDVNGDGTVDDLDKDTNGDSIVDEDDKIKKVVGRKDDAIGGKFRAYLGAEYSIPLYGDILRGVVFLDSGTVEEDYRITSWRVSTGFGFHLNIGSTPVVLNFGFPLTKDEDDDTELISFTMGWYF